MLGIAPDDTGRLPDSDAARLREFDEAVQSIYGPEHNLTRQATHITNNPVEAAIDNDPATFWSAPARHATLELRFEKPITFDRTVTMEWLNEGQRIEDYSIEALQNGAWKTIARAQAIGHKKIDIFSPVTTQRVRLNLLSTVGSAGIREFQLFNGTIRNTTEQKK